MDASIQELFNNLGERIVGHLAAANDRASAAEERLQVVMSGLRALTDGSDERATGQQGREQFDFNVSAAQSPSARPGRVANETLLSALNHEWAGAGMLRQKLLNAGHSISEGSVYNRMRKLAASDARVESTTQPERWRISPHTTGETKSEPPKAPKKSRSGKVRAASNPPVVALATNDNPVSLQLPVLHHGDCLEVLNTVAASSVDLILADLPYGTTRCAGDVQLPLDELWKHYRRVLKPKGAVVLFASQPFTTALVASNPEWFRYALVWEKPRPSGFLHAANKPLKAHEDILVFSPGVTLNSNRTERRMTYNPQEVRSAGLKKVKARRDTIRYLGQDRIHAEGLEYESKTGYPRSIIRFAKDPHHHHPFQKPVALLQYLIETYSNPGEMVLDNTLGSGSTCVAAMRIGRRSVGIEQDKKWFEIAKARVDEEKRTLGSGGSDSIVKSHTRVPAAAIAATTKTSDVTLYQGDCLEVMRTIPSGSVDMVFTSPPYNLGVSTGGGIRACRKANNFWPKAALANGYASYDDARDPADYVEWQKEVLRECWRLLSPTGAIFYQHKPRGQNKVLQTPLDLNPGLPVRQIIIWNRKSGMAFNRCYFLPTHEWIVVFAKSDFRLTKAGKRFKDVWDIGMERNNPHPAPFPVELPRRAIEATDAKVILDPFMGSGTTGVAALQCGREFIGIELDPGYLQTAKARIEKARIEEAVRLAA